MQRTLYTDGIEVDESDLDNTENTKVSEILLSRTQLSRFGVIEGLTLTIINNSVTVGVGKASLFNGEIINLISPLTDIVGASFEAGRSSFFGLRLTEVTSNPKAHEVDPVTFDTRAAGKPIGEFFVATEATAAARTTASTNAINAQTVDGNFILLGEFEGTGTGFVLRQNTPLPRTKGGDQPLASSTPKTNEQKSRLQDIYEGAANNEFPIHSAKDDFHRSLIGTGSPTPNNPHGMTLEDIGGDKNLQDHLTNEHTNGLVGLEPSDDDFTPVSGSFAFSTANTPTNAVNVGAIIAPDLLVIRGNRFNSGSIAATTVSFAGKSQGLYYIVAKFGSDSAALEVLAIGKTTAESPPNGFDALCPQNNGTPVWLNNAQEISSVSGLLENKFFVIGLVFWNGSNTFRQIAEFGNIQIPSPGGEITYTPFDSTSQFFIPPGKTTLDLRRFGTISNENIQKRTIRLDRLVTPVTPLTMFVAHAGATAQSLTGIAGQRAVATASVQAGNPFGGDQLILKHLTNFDANNLFGHRGSRGSVQHAAVVNSDSPGAPPLNRPENYGFQNNIDKWKQDNLTMTILKWSDLDDVNGGPKTMGDSNVSAKGNIEKAGRYAVGRSGHLANMLARVGNIIPSGGAASLTVDLVINDTVASVFIFNENEADGTIKHAAGGPGVFPISASFAAPTTIGIRRTASKIERFKNLTVTLEYHYES